MINRVVFLSVLLFLALTASAGDWNPGLVGGDTSVIPTSVKGKKLAAVTPEGKKRTDSEVSFGEPVTGVGEKKMDATAAKTAGSAKSDVSGSGKGKISGNGKSAAGSEKVSTSGNIKSATGSKGNGTSKNAQSAIDSKASNTSDNSKSAIGAKTTSASGNSKSAPGSKTTGTSKESGNTSGLNTAKTSTSNTASKTSTSNTVPTATTSSNISTTSTSKTASKSTVAKSKSTKTFSTSRTFNPSASSNAKTTKTSKKSRKLKGIGIELYQPLTFKYAILLDVPVEKVTDEKLIQVLDHWYGTRYRFGGESRKGIDCSAFTQAFMRSYLDYKLPRVAAEQFNTCKKIKKKKLRQGDLVFFATHGPKGGITHVGVYLFNDRFVHSASSTGVRISNLNDDYYTEKYAGAGRIR